MFKRKFPFNYITICDMWDDLELTGGEEINLLDIERNVHMYRLHIFLKRNMLQNVRNPQ